VVDPASQAEKNLIKLIQVARALKAQQPDFYSRLSEMRWSDNRPIVFMEGLQASIFLSKDDPAKNIPNFQALFIMYINNPDLNNMRYFDLRWDTGIAVGLPENTAPQVKRQ
jgi:hypothetical protein